MKERIMMHG